MIRNNHIANINKSPYIFTISSGKGGVGKSVLAANMAYCLSKSGFKVLLWDADRNFPNQHLLLGVEPPVRLKDVFSGIFDLTKAVFNISDNFFILADTPASGKMEILDEDLIRAIYVRLLSEYDFDIILIDTPAGYSDENYEYFSLADSIAIVITDEPTSLLDGYGLIKILLSYISAEKFSLLVNNVIDWEDADDITRKLNLATMKFLNFQLDVLGFVPYDRVVRQSILQQNLFMIASPGSDAANAVNIVIDKIITKIEIPILG